VSSYDDGEDEEDDGEPGGGANIVLLRVAAAATVLAVGVAIVLLVVVNGGSGGGGGHNAASAASTSSTGVADPGALTTTTANTSTVTLTRTVRPRTTATTSTPAAPPGAFTATPPAGFVAVEHAVSHGRYVESRWQAGAEYALVDMSPRSGLSPEQAAAGVVRTTSAQPGYQQIAFGPGRLTRGPSAVWIFRLPGTERVDFFFSACGHDFGVLGVTTPGRFNDRLPDFAALANSVRC
jgi:hypothetical protein